MRIVAIIAVRNELAYLRELIPYLARERIEVVLIDNDSSDGTPEAFAGAFAGGEALRVERLPYEGSFDLSAQLAAKAQAAERTGADWIIHQDADEVLQSPTGWGGLRRHIETADARGFNVLNFTELVMLPKDPDVDDFIRNNSNFYVFEPKPQRLMRAWRRDAGVSNIASGGHRLAGGRISVYPERMILKHFLVRSQAHAFEKYLARRFSPADLEKGWHGNRLRFDETNLLIPTSGPRLHGLSDPTATPGVLPEPETAHFWEWPSASGRRPAEADG